MPDVSQQASHPAHEEAGHWCDFCQTFHSSMSCYHPGNNDDRSTHPTVAQLEATIASLTRRLSLSDATAKRAVVRALGMGKPVCADCLAADTCHDGIESCDDHRADYLLAQEEGKA